MQAIISDIIVSQAAQSGGLQISQNTNNSSSNSVSFADMLASLNKGVEQKTGEENVQKTEPVESRQTEQSKPVENANESDKSEKIKDEKLTSAQEKPESDFEQKKQVENHTGETETARKTPVKNGENVELQKTNDLQSKAVVKKDAAEPQEGTKGKKVMTDDEKKALLQKQNLEILQNESHVQEQNELPADAAALAGQTVQALVNENEPKLAVKIQNENEIQDLTTAVKTDAKTNTDFESKNIKEKISVVDLRSKPQVQTEAQESKPVEKVSKNLKVEYNSDSTATVTMELDPQQLAAGENILSLDNQTAAANGSDFQAMVSNQIQANAPDFVRTGTILLKDNDKGTINLVLHPDDLGNVKIHLSMDGKTISAHITVNTKEALEVFKDNAQTLREAFAKNGYETASFDVSYNGNSNGQGQHQNFEGRYDGMEYMARNAYSEFAGVQDDGYIQNGWENQQNSEYSINIVA